MNTKPITTARDDDLRLSLAALRRAAQRAQDLALQTGTAIVDTRLHAVKTTSPPRRRPLPPRECRSRLRLVASNPDPTRGQETKARAAWKR